MKKLQFIIRYLNYLLYAKGKHSVHAPFLYVFITKVLNTKTKDDDCKHIEFLRKDLCISDKFIQITDFGAGSSINNKRKRNVKDVVKNSAKNEKFGKWGV